MAACAAAAMFACFLMRSSRHGVLIGRTCLSRVMYAQNLQAKVAARDPDQQEFLQAVEEVSPQPCCQHRAHPPS